VDQRYPEAGEVVSWRVKAVPLVISFLLIAAYLGLYFGSTVSTLRLDETELEVRILLKNLEVPWDMDWSADGWIWFSEKKGSISRFSPESGELQKIHFIDEVHQSRDNSGLHALALHPEFPAEPYLYVHYTYSPQHSRLVRFRFDADTNGLKEKTVLLDELRAGLSHNGSRIIFSPDQQQLYLSLGEAFRTALAQDLSENSGKILRLNPDGGIPADNPFPGSPIWSFGHRNPQGLVFAGNGNLYSSEHGAYEDDELNLIRKGGNYGHPDVRGWCDRPKEMGFCGERSVIEPLKVWSPTYAVSGIEYYDHAAIPEWRNSILVTSLKPFRAWEGKRLQVLHLNPQGDRVVEVDDYFINRFGRLREVMATPDGRIFLFTSNREINFNKPRIPNPGDDKLIMLKSRSHPN